MSSIELIQALKRCQVNEAERRVYCLDENGNVFTFPLPVQIEYKDCDPCTLRKLIAGEINGT